MLDIKKLKKLQGDFLLRYPKGFNDPEMIAIGKKHQMTKRVEQAHEFFNKKAFANIHVTADNMVKTVSRSSMVSVFEKPKFRDFVTNLNEHDKAFLVESLKQLLHGQQKLGFEGLVDILDTEKLAKWSLVTIIPAYYWPEKEVFMKPTTVKNILKYFSVEKLVYRPKPSWDFYREYRSLINEAKAQVDENLSPSNAAFCGFLMMTVGQQVAA